MTYTQILNQAIAIYRESGAEAAYAFVDKEGKALEAAHPAGHYPQIDNFRFCLAAATGRTDTAMAMMREAIEDKGYWYGYDYLMTDEDLDPLRNEADFKKWLQVCKRREQEALANQESKILLLGNEGIGKALLMALHGNQENLEIAKPYWEGAVDQGYLVALLQSSQIEFSHGYNWNDVTQGVAEVGTYFEALQEEGLVDSQAGDPVWIGGFSAGCSVALRAILDGAIPARQFVFMAPWLPDLEDWKPELEKLKEMGVSGHILVGDQDCDCQEGAEDLYETLKGLDLQVVFEKIEGLGHDYPKDFQTRLAAWMA